MITPEAAARNIGREVRYTPYGGPVQEGVITGSGAKWVWIRFGTDPQSKATAPDALDFIGGES